MDSNNYINQSKNPTILLIDDEPANLSVLTKILNTKYKVFAVTSGIKAIAFLKNVNNNIDLILLDIMMPDMDGYETISLIRKEPELLDIPVIFITTLENDINEVLGFKRGAVDYIHKPINPAIVHLRINTQLELKKNRESLSNQNLWLEKEIKRQVNEKSLLLEITLTTIVGLAETRDTETGDHIVRTKEYVKTLAENLYKTMKSSDLLLEDIPIIAKAAQLHDIGKIGIPDSILLKPGPLTPSEFNTMKSHCRIGGDALNNAIIRTLESSSSQKDYMEIESFKLLDFARTIAYNHHEKWDGSGYPRGLAGDQIPLPARIMAVADVFDALTSKRVYKEATTLNNALKIISEGKGTHFDPLLVDVLLNSRNEFQEIFDNN